MTFVSDLEPKSLWRHFDQILTIPRGSKEEDRIRAYVVAQAEEVGLPFQVDGTGNVVVNKPATAGYEDRPVTILQSHLDMVNEKNSDVDHDFDKDPIQPREDGEYLTASGTTLGSDNGIGVAAMLAIMEADDLTHGPLELLFTIDEETGLTGAANLDPEMLRGRRLINLDSEEEGSLCVGCAGGADSEISLPISKRSAPEGSVALKVELKGLKGGHSGIDIHLQRGNATQLLTRALWAVGQDTPFNLASLAGGNKHNAVPREASAVVVLDAQSRAAFEEAVTDRLEAICEEFRPAEPGAQFSVSQVDVPEEVWDHESTGKVMALVVTLPHGVISMSYDIPGLVETSTNLATVKAQNGTVAIGLSSRSSVASALEALRQRIRSAASLAGASVEEGDGYPGWKPDLQSELLQVVRQVHEREIGTDPKIEAIHAGLECGLIGEMIPGMDMISFGPQIEFPHSPDERVKIASVDRFYKLLAATLEELATAS
ncbi:MAG: beta-Ala-His dipeptidase [Nitrospirae bacterium]|nr:beta-Ala-His dipeptidase [Nitrospirota bacterium]